MNRRLFAGTATLIIALFFVSGRPAGPPEATTTEGDPSLKTFTQVLSLVEDNYVDEVASRDLVFGAIRGMLARLDPHSSFLDPKAFKEMQEEQHGSFSGLGIVISIRGEDKELTVISPIEGTPAYRAGIRAGDVISHIEGKPTAGIAIDEALEKLRGPKGTRVSISIQREGEQQPLDFSLVRDDIPTASIPYSFMLTPGVGYIRIKQFTQTTDNELDQKIRMLQGQGMTKLVLDLRWNPGGLLDQAVKVSDRFLAKPNQMIVYTKGRRGDAFQEYRTSDRAGAAEMPLVVLINKGSASASEIVASAIQDHDRGLLVGETTWGKGLVQTVQRLSHSCAIALTTAKYYTPSGRLIQRDYKTSLEDYFSGRNDVAEEKRETRFTDAGRKVLGGGGISPDVEISLPELTTFEQALERKAVFFDYGIHFVAEHKDRISRDFAVDDRVLADFRDFVKSKKVEYTEKSWEESRDYISTMIRAEVLGAQYGLEERQKVISERDPQILKALEVLPAAEHVPVMMVEKKDKPKAGDDQKAQVPVDRR